MISPVWPNNLMSYADGSVATSRITETGRVNCGGSRERHPNSPGCCLSTGFVSQTLQNDFVQKTIKLNSQLHRWLGSMPGLSCRKKETNIHIVTWNVRTIIHSDKMNKLEMKYGNLVSVMVGLVAQSV